MLLQGILPILLSCDSELLEFKEVFTSVGRVCVIVGKNRQGPEGEWKSVESKKVPEKTQKAKMTTWLLGQRENKN